ncbi:DUF1573 domain-containing protein [Echinicola jeungdonensis]|uniref:DUF1573 domain-containing protein n=1 Tax=Echinicola jeungdonensis TaxID=709343 RepID=UPI0025B5F93F|nr:DUF1573 domain-containing protein [Echinicola jeungdonensis]MDN3671213.1 DUF1573 domain-containing protein [Echinicola jeungdonensis]
MKFLILKKVAQYYNSRVGDLGFRFSSINMGEVFTNKPKIKYVDFYNFKDMPITLDEQRNHLPEHLKINMIPAIVPAKSRGLLAIQYDGAIKNDLGFFDEIVPFHIEANGDQEIELRLLTTVHEYFDPVPKSEVDNIPKLAISEVEVDLGKISSNRVVSKSIKLTNIGEKPVNIRKIVTNCDCVDYELKTMDLLPGEDMDLLITFDPKGS